MAKQKHVFIAGASGGVGSALSRRLARAGFRVTLAGRNQERLAALADELDAPSVTLDATDVQDVESALQKSAESAGGLDAVVNCVGSLLLKPAHLTTPDEWSREIATNLTSCFALLRAAFPLMREQGGSIVFMTSAAARTGLPNHEAIAAAKAGVIGLMQSAAATYASKNVRVNAVAPGLIETPLTERIRSNEKAASASRSLHPLGRFGKPEEIAAMIAWLLGDESHWVTGQTFGVDGGLATLRPTPR